LEIWFVYSPFQPFLCLEVFPNSFALQQTKVIWRRYCFHPHSKYQFKCIMLNMLLHNTSQWWSTFFLICFHTVVNNSSLFMSMSNLISINITIMDIKRHILICLLISVLVRWVEKKREVVGLGNEGLGALKLSLKMSMDDRKCLWNCSTSRIIQYSSKKSPIY
jgi:hypothetical protein